MRRVLLSAMTVVGLLAGGATAASAAAPSPVGPVASGVSAASVGAQSCSEDPITMGYYRMWRDVNTTKPEDRAPNSQRLDDVPASLDIVSVFATPPEDDPDFWDALRDEYLPSLHGQGTEVVFTIFVDEFIGSDIAMNQASYDAVAQDLYDTYMVEWGIDGLDIDVERSLSGDELTRAVGVLTALGELIGPNSGTDHLFIYDTNLTGDHPLFQAIGSSVDYVLLQAYGRSASSLQGTWETFASKISSCQFLPGFSFYEENGVDWGDVTTPIENSRAADYAHWQPSGGEKGGVFAYAIDRDGKAAGDDTISRSDFSWMQQLEEWQLEDAS